MATLLCLTLMHALLFLYRLTIFT